MQARNNGRVSPIRFADAPFTLACYPIEGTCTAAKTLGLRCGGAGKPRSASKKKLLPESRDSSHLLYVHLYNADVV